MKPATLFCSFGRCRRLGLGVLFLLWAAFGLGCKSNSPAEFKLVTTITHLGDLANNLVGDRVDVVVVCKSGVDPHVYVATPRDVRTIQEADVIYAIGLNLESQLLHFLKSMPKAVLLGDELIGSGDLLPAQKQSDNGLQSLEKGFSEAYDPHIWGDVRLWKNILLHMKNDLLERLPEHKGFIEGRARWYEAQLDELDGVIRRDLASIPRSRRVLLTSHDAFGYFSRAYDLTNKALLGVSSEAEASSKEVIALSKWVIDNKVEVMFTETTIPNKFLAAVQAAVRSEGGEVRFSNQDLFSDSLGIEGTEEATYIGMMRHNARVIVGELTRDLERE